MAFHEVVFRQRYHVANMLSRLTYIETLQLKTFTYPPQRNNGLYLLDLLPMNCRSNTEELYLHTVCHKVFCFDIL